MKGMKKRFDDNSMTNKNLNIDHLKIGWHQSQNLDNFKLQGPIIDKEDWQKNTDDKNHENIGNRDN